MPEEMQSQEINVPTPIVPILADTPTTDRNFAPTPKPSHLLPIIVSSIITSLILVGAYLLFLNKNSQPIVTIPSPTSSAIVQASADYTSDWQTYTNKDLGFEIKYPPTVSIDKEMNDQYNRATIFKGDNLNFQVMLREIGTGTLDKYYFMDNPDYSKSLLDKRNANVYIYDDSNSSCVSDGSGPGCPISYVVYVAQNGSDLYHLGFYGTSKISDLEKQILSTFKFIDVKVTNQCNTDSQCGVNFCDCKAELIDNITNSQKSCMRVCNGQPKCINNQCILK